MAGPAIKLHRMRTRRLLYFLVAACVVAALIFGATAVALS